MVANGNNNLNKFQQHMECRFPFFSLLLYLNLMRTHDSWQICVFAVQCSAVHTMPAAKQIFSFALCLAKEHQKIWKKNKQRNAVSWLLTPFLDCTYEERPYRCVDSQEQKWFVFFFFRLISTPKLTSSTR